MKALKIRISGRIQRTGYRWFIVELARDLRLHGTIEFAENGDLLIHVQGEDKDVEKFVSKLKTPPPHASIREFSMEETKPDSKLRAFTVKYGTIGDELHEGFGPIQHAVEEKLNEISIQISTLKSVLEEVRHRLDELTKTLKTSR